MKATSFVLAATALLTPTLAIAQDDHGADHWYADFDTAAAVAKKEGKNLFVDFTGSDWCGWCIRLHKEVFDHEEFMTAATKDYVLVALDFPRAEEIKAKVPNPERNEELQQKYGVRGFPTILMMTPAGEVFARTGYQQGGAENYVKHMAEIAEKGKADLEAIQKMTVAIETATGDAKIDLYFKAAERLGTMEGDAAGAGTLAAIVRDGMKLDPDNDKGLKLASLKSLMKAGQVDAELVAAAKAMDPKNEAGLMEQAVASVCRSVASREQLDNALAEFAALHKVGIKDKAIASELYTNAANWCERFAGDHDTAVVYAKKALELDPSPRAKEMLEGIVNG